MAAEVESSSWSRVIFFKMEPTRPANGLNGRWCCCSVAKSCLTLCNPMDCSTPCFPVLHYLLEFFQTHVHESVMPSNHLILCCPLLLLPQSLSGRYRNKETQGDFWSFLAWTALWWKWVLGVSGLMVKSVPGFLGGRQRGFLFVFVTLEV